MKKNITRKSILKGKRKHGFRKRIASSTGRNVLRRRRQKGKHRLTI